MPPTIGLDRENQFASQRGGSGGADERDDLVVRHFGHVSAIDHQHHVALVQTRMALVRRAACSHSAHNHWVMLIGSALKHRMLTCVLHKIQSSTLTLNPNLPALSGRIRTVTTLSSDTGEFD